MGLDSYALITVPLDDDKFEGIGTLCGGMLSKGQGNSFRGKVYDDFIQDVTALSLYDEIDSHDCRLVSEDIKQWLDDNPTLDEWNDGESSYPVKRDEIITLMKWFKIVYLNDASYYPWY